MKIVGIVILTLILIVFIWLEIKTAIDTFKLEREIWKKKYGIK